MQSVEEAILGKARIAAWHTDDTHDVHRYEDRVDADKRDPEVNLADRFVHEATKHLREPEVERREHTEDRWHADRKRQHRERDRRVRAHATDEHVVAPDKESEQTDSEDCKHHRAITKH